MSDRYLAKLQDKFPDEYFDIQIEKLTSKLIVRMMRDYLTNDAATIYNYQFLNVGYYEWMLKCFSQKNLFEN